jgi:hypothetical protein
MSEDSLERTRQFVREVFEQIFKQPMTDSQIEEVARKIEAKLPKSEKARST